MNRSIALRRFALSVALLAAATSLGAAEDWPQWRGPNRDAVSQETGLLQEWPKEGPKQVWRIEGLGEGYSTPSVAGGRIYLLVSQGVADEFVKALDARDGKELWSLRIGAVGHPEQQPPYPGSRSTPTVDGQRLYALGSDGDLVCIETDSGKPIWKKNLRSDFGGQFGEWAYAESPLIDGDVLVCTPGGETATLVALNKANGDLIWKSAIPGGDKAAYSSPIKVSGGGRTQYVQFLHNGVVGVDAKTGEFLWRDQRPAQGSPANMPTPVAFDGMVYAATGRGGAGLVKLVESQGKVEAQPVYFSREMPTSIGGSVKVGDYLYGTNNAALMCIEFATGKQQWIDRSVGASSILYADKRLYLHSEKGDLALVEATPEGYREKGRFTPQGQPDRGRSQAWTYPVLADGRLYVRDFGVMWCFDVKASP